MQLTPETLSLIYTNLDMRFNQSFTNTEVIWNRIATEVPSTGKGNTYPLTRFLVQMREWIGERQVQTGASYEYSIVNKEYEGTISVLRKDIEDDQVGMYGSEADALGEAAKLWPEEVIFDTLAKGEELTGHDGQFFFDTDHPQEPGVGDSKTHSNIFFVPDLTGDTLAYLETKGAEWAKPNGDSLGIVFNTLVVPTGLKYKAQLAMGSHINVGGAAITNPMANAFDLLVAPRLKDPKAFYLMMTNKALKPLIWQLRKAPVFTSLDAPTDTNVFWRREYIYGVDARGNAGFGLWFMALKAKVDATKTTLNPATGLYTA